VFVVKHAPIFIPVLIALGLVAITLY